jgi:hypothetical protein
VRLRVDFRKGLLSQWFPVTDRLGPPEMSAGSGPLDVSKVERSFLEWEVDVLPPDADARALPAVEDGSPWAWQRSPGANLVRTVPRTSPRAGPVETEKFLFYRGVGSFDLPVRAQTEAGSRLVLENGGKERVPSLFVLHVEHGRGAFRFVSGIEAGGRVEVGCPLPRGAASVDAMVRELVPALVVKLVERGLYEDEAIAMARTWERSYFKTDGLRVLYVVPDETTRAILPLAVDPEPKSIVRVLVGRLECIGPEKEAEVRQALRDRLSDDRRSGWGRSSASRASAGSSSRICGSRSRARTARSSRARRACSPVSGLRADRELQRVGRAPRGPVRLGGIACEPLGVDRAPRHEPVRDHDVVREREVEGAEQS